MSKKTKKEILKWMDDNLTEKDLIAAISDQEVIKYASDPDNYHVPGIDMQVEAYNENFPGELDGLDEEGIITQFNAETAIGVAVLSLVKKYSNDQELGKAIRDLVNSL